MQAGQARVVLAARHNPKLIVTRLMLCLFLQRTMVQEEKTFVLQSIMLGILMDRLLQVVLQLLMQEEQHVMPMNAAGEAQRHSLAWHRAAGAATQQATAAAIELYAHGQQRMPPAKAGLQTAQVPAIGDYPHKMR